MRFVDRLKFIRSSRRNDERPVVTGPVISQKLASLESDFDQIVRDVAAVSLNKRAVMGQFKIGE